MLAGFEQFQGVLDPPSGAFSETNDEVAAAIDRGGAAIAWLDDVPAGSIRFEPEESWLETYANGYQTYRSLYPTLRPLSNL